MPRIFLLPNNILSLLEPVHFKYSNLLKNLAKLICVYLLIAPGVLHAQTLAFPGAQGEARFATGGRGGQVIKVTNLNNSGPGSFRNAVEASGPRIVVFEVGGTIHLTNAVVIDNGDLTIAGQTAPGEGISIADKIVKFRSSNIITRYIRFRGDGNDDCIELIANNGVETNNLIFDHCSISWGGDENVGSIGTNGGIRQVTFQDCISSEGILEHSMGMLITKNNATEFDIIRCLFAFSNARNPKFASGSSGNCVNNLMAGYGNAGLRIDQNVQINAIGNIAVNSLDDKKVITLTSAGTGGQPTMVYVKDNIGPGRETNTGDDWLAVSGDDTYRVLTPAVPLNDIPVMDPNEALDFVLDNAGASLIRDEVDQRIVDQVRDNTGGLISVKPAAPELVGGTPPLDSDNDGMSNDWENTHGLNPNEASDQNLDRTGDGYTNIEEYINSFGISIPIPSNTPPTISSIADQVIDQDFSIGPLDFTIGDAETSADVLTVTASSSNTSLVPSFGAMVLAGNDANRNITITPASGQDGTAVITISVSDGTTSTSTTFELTVNDVPTANTPPTITSIADQFTDVDVSLTVEVFIDDEETPASDLTLSVVSNNTTLVPNANLVLGGNGANRNLTITPASSEIGTAFITITLSDGIDQDQGSFNFTVNQPGNNDQLTLSLSPRHVSCFDGDDGRITSTVSGGTPPYTYLWSNGGSSPGNSNLIAGTYTLTVTDADDNNVTETEVITEPTEIQLDPSVVDATCNVGSGSIDLQITGGVEPYTYSWSNGATTASVSNLSAGDYSVTVTDANNCTRVADYNVGSGAEFTFTATIQDANCGSSDGSISVSVTGSDSYTYLWSNGITTATASGLIPGTYSVTITDSKGCGKSASYDVSSNPGEVNFQVTSNQSDVSCNGNDGSIELTVSGGVAPYSYDWSHGATSNVTTGLVPGAYSVVVTDANGCFTNWSTTLDEEPDPENPTFSISGNTLTASSANSYQWFLDGSEISGAVNQTHQVTTSGEYFVRIWNENGCSAVSGNLTVNIDGDSSNPLSLSLNSQDISCFGAVDGEIASTVSGGTAPYAYKWSDGSSTPSKSNLRAGMYSLTVTDSDDKSITSSIDIYEPDEIQLEGSIVNSSCNNSNGSISVQASGGAEPFRYQWSNGATSSSINGLAPGEYILTVYDESNCSKEVSYNVSSEADLTFEVSIKNADCGSSNGSIDLSVSNFGTYTYNWSNGATTANIDGLNPGIYSVTITDQSGCSKYASFVIGANVGEAGFEIVSSVSNATCAGDNGLIELSVSGGMEPYTFEWNNGATGNLNSGLGAGTYNVTITDANGCYTDWGTAIGMDESPPKPTISQSENTLIASKADNYQWYIDGQTISGAIDQSIQVTKSGEYSVEIFGETDCSSLSDPLIVELEAMTLGDSRISSLEVYPNPVTSILNVRLLLNQSSKIGIRIFSIEGIPVMRKSYGMFDFEMETSIDLNGLIPGVYIIQIKASNEVVTRRIICI